MANADDMTNEPSEADIPDFGDDLLAQLQDMDELPEWQYMRSDASLPSAPPTSPQTPPRQRWWPVMVILLVGTCLGSYLLGLIQTLSGQNLHVWIWVIFWGTTVSGIIIWSLHGLGRCILGDGSRSSTDE